LRALDQDCVLTFEYLQHSKPVQGLSRRGHQSGYGGGFTGFDLTRRGLKSMLALFSKTLTETSSHLRVLAALEDRFGTLAGMVINGDRKMSNQFGTLAGVVYLRVGN
jgi:hypothetical protein